MELRVSFIFNTYIFINVLVWFDPADIAKATKILYKKNYKKLNVVSPNLNEMIQYVKAFDPDSDLPSLDIDLSRQLDLEVLIKSSLFKVAEKMLSKMKSEDAHLFVTLGPLGVLALTKSDSGIQYQIVPPPVVEESEKVVSVSGAGDS